MLTRDHSDVHCTNTSHMHSTTPLLKPVFLQLPREQRLPPHSPKFFANSVIEDFFFFLRIYNIAILSLKIKFYEIVSYVKVAFVGCFSDVV